MSDLPTVMIDPDGTCPWEWMYVVVERSTGIRYGQQYGGTATRYDVVEGFLAPVFSIEARQVFDEVFLGEMRGSGVYGGGWDLTDAVLTKLAEAVARIHYWNADPEQPTPSPLILDVARAAEIDEAWLPVTTADGPGILMWPNSD